MPYPNIEIQPDSVIGDEQLGSKPKFWFSQNNDRWLFKERRSNTGEDWAEKLASEIAKIVQIKAAKVELASYGPRFGCASQSFVAKESDALVHGNEILAGQIAGYDRAKKRHHSDHTFENIATAVQKLLPQQHAWQPILETLAGYLVLDALICNTDRHHENWGLLFRSERLDENWQVTFQVAPSFDHASSLGRELLDTRAARYLEENRIEGYVRAGHGGIYLRPSDTKGTNPLHLVELANRKFPEYFRPALQKVRSVPVQMLQSTVDELPADRISPALQRFIKALLAYTHPALVSL
jgi:hypothetical protein